MSWRRGILFLFNRKIVYLDIKQLNMEIVSTLIPIRRHLQTFGRGPSPPTPCPDLETQSSIGWRGCRGMPHTGFDAKGTMHALQHDTASAQVDCAAFLSYTGARARNPAHFETPEISVTLAPRRHCSPSSRAQNSTTFRLGRNTKNERKTGPPPPSTLPHSTLPPYASSVQHEVAVRCASPVQSLR